MIRLGNGNYVSDEELCTTLLHRGCVLGNCIARVRPPLAKASRIDKPSDSDCDNDNVCNKTQSEVAQFHCS